MLQDVKPNNLAELVRPLCQETANLLKPVPIAFFDRLFLSMQDDRWFRCSVKRQTQANGEVRFDSYASPKANSWPSTVPENKYDAHSGCFLLGATDITALMILASWPQTHIVYESESARLKLETLALRFIHQFERSAVPQAQFKADKTLPETEPVAALREVEGEPSPYQSIASYCAAQADGGFAQFMDTGTGKTIVSIETAALEMERRAAELNGQRPLRVLVVCPKQLRSNWGRELKKFCRRPFHFINCHGSKIDRAKHVIDCVATQGVDISAMVISYGNVRGSLGTLLAVKWDLVIADESDNFKSHATKTWQAMKSLRDNSDKRLALTATPVCNSLNDLWTQLEFLGEGYSGFVTFEAFRKFYCSYVSQGTGVQRLVGYQNVPLLQERLTRMSYIIGFDEALPDVPEVTHDTIDVELTDEQREIYEQLKMSLAVEIEDKLEGGENLQIKVNNVLTMLLRLAHITCGWVTYDPVFDLATGDLVRAKRLDRFDPNPKLEELVELVKNSRPNQKIIIWSCWTQDIRTISQRLEMEGFPGVTFYGATSDSERDTAEYRFNNQSASECKWLCGNPQCGGVGLNLLGQADDNTDCDWIIEYGYNWSWRTRKQGRGRNRRRGTRVRTRVTTLVAEDSIDEDIYDVLQRKGDTALNLQDLRAILDKVLKIK